MTYKEFLQALANAYKNTTIKTEAFMCLVLSPQHRAEGTCEGAIAEASGIVWDDSVKEYEERLKYAIASIEYENRLAWVFWAHKQFPEIQTDHQVRAHWLQIQADNA